MKAQRGSRGIALPSFSPWRAMGLDDQLYAPAALPSGKETRYPFYRGVRGPQAQSGAVREILQSLGFDPRSEWLYRPRYFGPCYIIIIIIIIIISSCGPGWRSRYSDLLRAESNHGGGEIFRTPPDRRWGLYNLLYNGYRVPFPGVKRPGRGANHPPHLAPRLKKE